VEFGIRPFNPVDEEYLACLAIGNACWPEYPPNTLEQWKYRDETARKDKFRARFVLRLDGTIIGWGDVSDPYWLKAEGRIQYSHTVHPDHEELVVDRLPVHSHVERHVLNLISDRPINVLLTGAREDKEVRVGWLTDNGYAAVMRYPSSSLDIATFDFGEWEDHVERVESSGIEFHTLAHLQEHDPDWHAKLHEAWVEVDLDVPGPNEPKPVPVDEFDKMLKSPSLCPETNLIAVDNSSLPEGGPRFGAYAGLTCVNPALSDSSVWEIWLTGVRRHWRRQGIATAIKLKSIAQARDMGGARFETGNEENNPMYDINIKLGFKPSPAWQDYEKPL